MIVVGSVLGSNITNQQPRLRGRNTASNDNEHQPQRSQHHKKKQAEVIHHRLSSNVYELIYYYDQDIVTNPASLHDQGLSSSVSTDSALFYDESSNDIGSSESNVYKVSIYKEPKCHTSVGTAIYTCNNSYNHHQHIQNDMSTPSNNNNEAICTIQIIFYSSNTVTNQTTNTLHMQGIVTTPFTSATTTTIDQRNRRLTDASDISTTNTNTFSIIGGTGIYFGASGQSRITTTTYNRKENPVYKTIATFSILPTQQQSTRTARASSSSSLQQQQDATKNNPNATLPIIPTINNTNNNSNNNKNNNRDLIHHPYSMMQEQKQGRIRWTQIQT
jgi:hypothetical protein